MKYNKISIMGIPGEEGKQDIENLCEKIITKIFPNWVKEKDMSKKLREFQTS